MLGPVPLRRAAAQGWTRAPNIRATLLCVHPWRNQRRVVKAIEGKWLAPFSLNCEAACVAVVTERRASVSWCELAFQTVRFP